MSVVGGKMDTTRTSHVPLSYLEVDGSIHSTHVEPVLVQDMIQSVTSLIEPQVIHERRQVQLDIPADLTVQADPVRLRQVLLNIAVNALKYSPPRTPLIFSAQLLPGSEDEVVIGVIDRGKGTPRKTRHASSNALHAWRAL